MKILQVSPPWIDTPPKHYGGTEWVVANLCEGLLKAGHEVTLFATRESCTSAKLDYLFPQGLSLSNIPWEASLPALLHYDQALKEANNYDLVHLHLSSQSDLTFFPYIKRLEVPHVITNHGHWPYDVFSGMDEMFNKLYAKDINMISISKFMQTKLPKQFKSVGYAYNAIDEKSLHFNEHPKDYLTWIGRIEPKKGLYEAIMAAKQAGEKFIFAGGVVDTNNKENIAYFEEKVKPLIDNDQIQYIGFADLKKKNELLSNAKAFLNPIQWEEPFGMVMIESMACGTPVLSFAKGAAPEIIKHGKTGYLVNSIQEMVFYAKQINELSRANCRKHVEHNFTVPQTTQQYLSIYEKVIKKFNAVRIPHVSTAVDKIKHIKNNISDLGFNQYSTATESLLDY